MTETNLGMAMKNVFLGGNVISDWFWLLEQNRVQEMYACIFSPAISPITKGFQNAVFRFSAPYFCVYCLGT